MPCLRVCHISTAHPMFDVRIFFKECLTLRAAGFDVHLIIAHTQSENVNSVAIHALPKTKARLLRMSRNVVLALRKAFLLKACVYHLHDPELIPAGLILKICGKRVIYDAHESLSLQTLRKDYIPKPLRSVAARFVFFIQRSSSRVFDFIITATPFIDMDFHKWGCSHININNYPLLAELYDPQWDWSKKKGKVCYVGAIDEERGIYEMVNAMSATNAELILAGRFSSSDQRTIASSLRGWSRVKELGQVDRDQIKNIFSQSMAGLVLYRPEPNHYNAQPNKLFEYMSAGIPVIASNFPLWKDIIEGYKCGLCCNPLDPASIGEAIRWIANHPEEAERMGENGRQAVEEKYNWEKETDKLLAVYKALMKSTKSGQ